MKQRLSYEGNAYRNFINSLKSSQTRRTYSVCLKLSQPKLEPIAVDSALYDRDLTTEEVMELEINTTGDFIVK